MTNFYKGGRELPNGKDSSCSRQIKSKKNRDQSLELPANFLLYFTRISQVLVKHCLSTDIALFTGQLRSQIYNGKTYYKSAWLILQKYLNRNFNLPAAKWEKNNEKREPSLDCLLTNFAPTSAVLRAGIQSCSGRPSDFPEAGPMPTRSGPDEIPISGRRWSGVGRYLNGQFHTPRGTIDSPLSYGECTEKVPKRYWGCTKKLLKIYQIATKKVQAVSNFLASLGCKLCMAVEKSPKGVKTNLVIGAGGNPFKLKGFKAACALRVCEDGRFVAEQKSIALRVLKYFSGYKKTYRILLACMMIISMFSLSAQTPRKDSGADGSLINAQTVQYNVLPAAIGSVIDTARITPLQAGDKVPEVFWNAEHSFLAGDKVVQSSLPKFRGKLLLLDFWEPYCYACLLKFPALDSLQAQLGEQGNIVLVSSKQYRRGTAEYISQKLDEQMERQQLRLGMDKIIQDDTLKYYFPHTYIPHYILIGNDGTVLALGSVEIFDTIAQIIKDEVRNNKNQRR